MLRNALRSARTRAPSTCDRWSGNACSLRLRKCCKGHREIEWHPQTHFGIEPQLTHEQPQSIIILILKRNLEGLQCGSSGKPDRYCIKAAITDSIVKQRERVRQHHRGAMRPGLASMATPDKNRRRTRCYDSSLSIKNCEQQEVQMARRFTLAGLFRRTLRGVRDAISRTEGLRPAIVP